MKLSHTIAATGLAILMATGVAPAAFAVEQSTGTVESAEDANTTVTIPTYMPEEGTGPVTDSPKTGLQPRNTCKLYANTPNIDYGNKRNMTAAVGRKGCTDKVSWIKGYLSRSKFLKDKVLASNKKDNVKTHKMSLSSWATKGHKYVSWVQSSTGSTAISSVVKAH